MSTKQKDAVYAAITAAQTQGLEGEVAHEFAVEQITQGLMAGEIVHSKGSMTDPKAAKSYARSLISNWKKKDERLNGGTKYVPETKRGPIVKDENLRKLTMALKRLKLENTDPELIARVEAAIETRKNELAQAKAATKVQSLDEALQNLADLGIDVA